MRVIWFCLFLLLLSILYPLTYSSPSESYLKRLESFYKDLKTLEGRFLQTTYIKDLDRKETFEGIFHLKSPDRMTWRYTKGSNDEAYLRDKEIIIYQPSESQAFYLAVDRFGVNNSPLRILLNIDSLEEGYIIKEQENLIFLKPKEQNGILNSIQFVLTEDKFPIKNILFIDRYGNFTELTLSDIKKNSDVSDSIFNFIPPKGTAMIRQ